MGRHKNDQADGWDGMCLTRLIENDDGIVLMVQFDYLRVGVLKEALGVFIVQLFFL